MIGHSLSLYTGGTPRPLGTAPADEQPIDRPEEESPSSAPPPSPNPLMQVEDLRGLWQPSPSTAYVDAEAATPAGVGDPVGYLEDQSGFGHHATQATQSAKPTLQRRSDGSYYLHFDGQDDYLELQAIPLVRGMSLAAKVQADSVSRGDNTIFGDTDGTDWLFGANDTENVRARFAEIDNEWVPELPLLEYLSEPRVLQVSNFVREADNDRDGAASTIYADGVERRGPVRAVQTDYYGPSADFFIGARRGGEAFWHGAIDQLLLSHSFADPQEVYQAMQ